MGRPPASPNSRYGTVTSSAGDLSIIGSWLADRAWTDSPFGVPNRNNCTVEHIRPHQLFNLVEPNDRSFVGQIPLMDSILSVESCVLAALIKLVKPAAAFEFGTYRGQTTRLIASNVPANAVVYTLDLDRTEGISFEGDDLRYATRALQLDRTSDQLPTNAVQLLTDSYVFDNKPYEKQIGFVFVDGNHALKYAERDTENAFRMLPARGPSAVAWHDYRNPDHPDLTAYLDQLSERRQLYHVEETMMVFSLNGFTVGERQTDAELG
jgi:predicted O-methyltransferase YrrM